MHWEKLVKFYSIMLTFLSLGNKSSIGLKTFLGKSDIAFKLFSKMPHIKWIKSRLIFIINYKILFIYCHWFASLYFLHSKFPRVYISFVARRLNIILIFMNKLQKSTQLTKMLQIWQTKHLGSNYPIIYSVSQKSSFSGNPSLFISLFSFLSGTIWKKIDHGRKNSPISIIKTLPAPCN